MRRSVPLIVENCCLLLYRVPAFARPIASPRRVATRGLERHSYRWVRYGLRASRPAFLAGWGRGDTTKERTSEEARVTAVPFLPKNAPFTAEDIDILDQLMQRSTPLQRSWLSGFLAGLDAAQAQAAQPVQATRPRAPLTILYGSESGNAESLALKAKKLAAKLNFDARVVDLGDVEPAILAKAKSLIVFVSTWGEGDPPQRAVDFYKALMADAAPRLDGVRFSVLSLGDTAYVNFCAIGRAIDARLEARGATRVADRIDLDLDFAKGAAQWTEKALTALVPAEGPSTTVVHVDFKGGVQAEEPDEPLHTAENPVEAEIA